MSKEIEFFNATSAESTSPEASGHGGSTSSAKYRASSRPNSVLLQSATETPDAAQRSLESRLSATNILQRMNQNSASRLSLSGPSGVDASTSGTSGKPKNRFAISTDTAAPAKASGATPKLPQKLRQHVSRLRNQFALGSGAASGSSRNLSVGGRTASASPPKAPRPSMPAAAINSKRFSIAAAAAMQYSRRSNQLQASKETEPETKAPKTPASPQDRESVVSAGTFQDLLRPLQTSLSCASLPAGWSSDEDDDAEQLFRQSERENSRMLRVCCSIDNLMLSIGDRAQEEKQSEAIVRGATRDLMKLYQFATKQVVSVIFDRSEDPSSSNNRGPRGDDGRAAATKMDGKEAQYAMEFLLEINDRIGKLYEFARTVFVDTVDGLRLQRKELEEGFTAAALKNEQLQSEMRDLRDFHEQNNVNAVDTFAIGTSGGRDAVLDNGSDTAAMGALAFPDVSPDSGGDECGALKQQCQELSRLLEMAKQEIRMSHHERDVQKARVAEISSALFHDSELGLLRNQLQSEKKRVRVLERENLTLRESQQEQSLKLQSLEALQTASSASTVALNNNSVTPGTRRMSAVQPQIETTPLSLQQDRAVLHEESVEEEPAVPATQLTVATQDNQYNFVSSVSEDIAPAVTEVNWFSRLVNPPQPANVRKSRKKLVESKPEQQPPVVLSKFLAGLLMTDKQLATAKEESKAQLREVIEDNQDQPITLETFNNLLLKFAVVPSPEELTARLGPFYQPTGDERKIPTDVFLALLMEAYKFQLQWRRDQLRALFIHLNHQEEVHQSAAENLVPTATGKEGRRQGGEEKKQPKSRMKRRRSRDGAVENGVGGSKYLRGLSRAVLRDLLLQAEIVHDGDIAQVDVDWLFAQLLQAAGGNAADITFDALFDVLQKMRWLDSSKLRVDALMETTGVVGSSTKKRPGSGQQAGAKRLSNAHACAVTTPSPMLRAVRDKWRVYARHSLVLCNNDPNLFIRRHSQRLLHYVDQHLVNFATESESGGTVSTSPDAIQCIREFLTFAWRVAAKRNGGAGVTLLSQACLTEVFLVSQALRVTFDSLPGYQWQLGAVDGKTTESQTTEGNPEVVQLHSSHSAISQDALQSFYDTARMDLKLFVKTEDPSKTAAHLHELENVLALYAAHIAHLFQRFSEARFNCAPQVSFHRWRAMVYELDLVHPHKLPFSKLQALFVSVVEALPRSGSDGTNEASLDQELGVGKTQFSELFVLIAMEIRRVAVSRKLEKSQLAAMKKPGGDHSEVLLEAAELTHRPARIMAAFCQEILAPRAFGADNALVERNFAAKLSCPLVGRALLEHRAFLRTVFFYYAKQDEIAEDERAALEEQALIREIQEHGGPPETHHGKDPEVSASEVSAALLQPDPGSDFQLEKTKRSSMSFGEFQNFLTAFGLLDAPDFRPGGRVTLADAQHVFAAVMSLDNDDTLQLEFDEFAAATVALAVHLNPSPFTLWHQKVDDFAKRLRKMWGAQSEAAR
ncbi:hypothetical protein PRIC2_010529 [Phytophthora ramorum]